MRKMSTEEFIKKSQVIYGNKFEYNNTIYAGSQDNLIITCKIHGDFTVAAHNHFRGNGGCVACQRISATKTVDEFIEQSNKIHKNKYNYSKSNYITGSNLITIICPIHGDFTIKPNYHIHKKQGCPSCSPTTPDIILKKFITKANILHGDTYDYSECKYIEGGFIRNIKCHKHGYFNQSTASHLKTGGCAKCGNDKKIKSTKQFIIDAIKVHKTKYDYTNVKYIGVFDQVKIKCSSHGEFTQKPCHHLSGSGCPSCSKSVSLAETEIYDFIKSLDGEIEVQRNTRKVIPPKEIDIFIPEYKLAIEYCGLYWHNTSQKHISKQYHYDKWKACHDLGIKLLTIYDDEWGKKQQIIKSKIRAMLNRTPRKIFGRKCDVGIISTDLARSFLNEHHIQGYLNSSIKIGVWFNGTLVGVMTFGKPRFTNNKIQYELYRSCCHTDINVVGGVGKMFSYFLKTYKPQSIISYADLRYGVGDVYKHLGFQKLKISRPNYFYTKDCKTRHSRYKFQKKSLVEAGYDSTKTETEIMHERGYVIVYDCGNAVWVYEGQ